MLFSKYKAKLDKYIYENITFRIITVVLVAIIAFQSLYIVSKANNEKVIFMPPQLIGREFSIVGDKLNRTYLEEIAQYISYNLLNITPETSAYNAENILALVETQNYQNTKTELIKQHRYIKNNGISRAFFLNGIYIGNDNTIEVVGIVKDSIANKIISSNLQKIIIKYKVLHGRFYITSLNIQDAKK